MPKPDWLRRRESKVAVRYKMCLSCKHVGEVCGFTNNIGKGKGRAKMYRCNLHPNSPPVYFKTYACTDYEYGPTGVT